jgi:hypothetical protein
MKSVAAVCVLLGSATAYTTPTTMGLRSFAKRILGRNKQDFLEAKPYYDQSNIPVNTFKAKVRSADAHAVST